MQTFVAIIGPSGVGKSTIMHQLINSGGYEHVLPITTRPRRPNEIDRVNVTLEEFEEMQQRGEVYNVNYFYGNWYAYSRKQTQRILAQGKTPIVDLIIDAIDKLRSEVPQMRVITIYIMPPSIDELKRRLENDKRFNPERFEKDLQDIALAKQHKGIDHFVVNDTIERVVDEIKKLVR